MRVLLVESLLMKGPQGLQKVYYFVSKSQKLSLLPFCCKFISTIALLIKVSGYDPTTCNAFAVTHYSTTRFKFHICMRKSYCT